MIHIAVPSYRTLADHEDPFNKFTVYDIHVNGAFHASVRYNLLYSLHEKLIDIFGFRLNAPDFPPKKLWKLDTKLLNERREGLAKYLQGVISNPDLARHSVMERVFLDFQVKSYSFSVSRLIKLEIFLPDGRPVNVECGSDEATNRFCRAIGIDEKNARYFGLFLCRPCQRCDENGTILSPSSSSSDVLFDMLCVRWLKNFESPWISQCLANKHCANNGHHDENVQHKIVVRRVTWDPCVEEPLLDDAGALKVLYLQAVNDIQRGLFQVPREMKEKLRSLQEYGDFKQFLRLCHLQPDYGYECLAPVHSDFPSDDSICELKVGRRQLIIAYPDDEGQIVRFALTFKRIRVWRVSHSEHQLAQMSFQLEYLRQMDEFGLITLRTDQSVLLSLFFQSIGDEILQDQHHNAEPSFKFDDNISLRAAELLETSKANSVVAGADDQRSIKSHSNSSNSNANSSTVLEAFNGMAGGNEYRINLISYQMPFLDHDNFWDVMDEDL
uniref:PX domain-containing protein n=1 Tax=Globodera pallida TaxID=36090 RepID=A0A183BVG8_GLOPA